MSWEPIGFMFFSTLEGVAIFSIMMSVFRLKTTEYLWHALFIILIMNLQSYVLREDLFLAFLAPVINMILFVLLLNTVMRLPLVWSAIITITGYFIFVVIQSLILKILFLNYTVAEVQGDIFKGYMLQSVSGVAGLLLSWLFYKFGYGFAAVDFEKLRLRFESVVVVIAIILSLVFAGVFLSLNNLWLNVSYFAIAAIFFLYYALRKEKWDD